MSVDSALVHPLLGPKPMPLMVETLSPPSPAVRPEQLAALRADMLRFARLQLRGAEEAEDLVQDAMEAALRNAASFEGKATLKTWVFAILRNRVVDHIRQASRTIPLSSLTDGGEDWNEQLENFFNEKGRWLDEARPARWQEPEQSMHEREFWGVFETCLEVLPANTARVFMMREFLGFESEEICGHLAITISNCHVILHRARLKLRDCMGKGWGRSGANRC